MSGDRHDMTDAEWQILRSVLSHKHQGPEPINDTLLILCGMPCYSRGHADRYATGLFGDGGMVWSGLQGR